MFLRWFMCQQVRAAIENGDGAGAAGLMWFLEFQRRGAPHVHFFYTHRVPWQTAAAQWANCIGDQSVERTATKFERIRAGRGGILAYARKYAAKVEQKEVPSDFVSPGRFWGVRGNRTRVACHMVLTGTKGGKELVDGVEAICERAHRAGLLRRWRWAEGDGFIYACRNGETLYSIGIGQEIDLLLMRFITNGAATRTDLLHSPGKVPPKDA